MSMTPNPDQPQDVDASPLLGGDAPTLKPTAAEVRQPVLPDHDIALRAGLSIGRYKILQLLGEGGFGMVYLAEQTHPVRRRVALKIIKPGMDSRAIVARFEAERQALALMSHPNIAKVLDAGTTPLDMPGGGRPYFAMEHIEGTPITAYCDTHRLTVEQRLKLFAVVCEAVQHAHMKGIIHRDLKPSNILVAEADQGEARPSVIDFGIAKALSDPLTEQTVFTARGMLIGTPEYMSPEQADNTEQDIDTRSDVYSLGVVLYELLTGALPFDSSTLRSAGVAAIQKMLREVDPPRPSTRLSTMGDGSASVAHVRGVERADLAALLRRELEWIPLKALRKDRSQRYRSASEMADDVANYLANRPLVAGPESAGYKARKFVRRNKGAVVAAGMIAATLILATGVSVWFGLRESAARQRESVQRAEAVKQTSIAETKTAEARKQAAIARAVVTFQTEMLASADPDRMLGDKVTVVQVMQAAVKKLDQGSMKDQPLVEAMVRQTIGSTLWGLARFDEAEPNLLRSLALRRANLPPGHEDLSVSLSYLGLLYEDQNRVAEAEAQFREALAIDKAALPADHPGIAVSMGNLASLLKTQQRFAEAESLCRDALAIYRKSLPPDHPDIAMAINSLGSLMTSMNRLDEAERLYRESLKLRRQILPPGHPHISSSLNNLAMLLQSQGRLAEAEPLMREALDLWSKSLPAGHPTLIGGENNLAVMLLASHKYAELESFLIDLLKSRRPVSQAGGRAVDFATKLSSLARAQQALGKTSEARAAWDESISIFRRLSPEGSPSLARVLWRSATARLENKDAAGALPELQESVAIAEKALLPEDVQLKEYRDALARCKAALGQ